MGQDFSAKSNKNNIIKLEFILLRGYSIYYRLWEASNENMVAEENVYINRRARMLLSTDLDCNRLLAWL